MGKLVSGCLAAVAAAVVGVHAQSTVLYETHFEANEGYDPARDLGGQNGWLAEGTGGNGLLDDWFEGLGQQAYVGFSPPTEGDVTTVWRPLVNPAPTNSGVIHFSVKMEIVPSTAGGDDDFRWAVYNRDGDRLFGVSFETATQEVWFQNEDLQFQSTGWTFGYDGVYDFHIWMDFARNSWTALLNDIVLANAEPITMTNTTPRNLSDVDAVWFINNPAGVGNNFMLFDNYRIAVENRTTIPAFMEPVERTDEGFFRFWIHGQKGVRYSVEYTTDFDQWFSFGEYLDETGSFLFEDDQAANSSARFYRLREVP